MAGRPRKSQSAEQSVNAPSGDNTDLLKVIQSLQAQIEALKSQVEKQPEPRTVKNEFADFEEDDDFDNIDIRPDAYIKVVSLTPYMLNLSTQPGGRGKLFTFPTFGTVKRIMYKDLVDILEVQRHFMSDGLFYIADKRVIRKNGLDAEYENILSKEKIEAILSGKSNDIVSIFKSATKKQQEFICDLIAEKLIQNSDSVDMNLVDKISRASGIKILEKVEEAREYQEILNNPTE